MKKPQPQQAVKKPRSDATFWRDGTTNEHAFWGAPQAWWWRLAGWKKAAPWVVFIVLALAFATHPLATAWVLAVTVGPAAGAGIVWLEIRRLEWGHYRSRVRPLAWKLAPVLALPPGKPKSWLDVPRDYATNTDAEIVIYPTREFTGGDRDMDDIKRAVGAALPDLEDPDFTPRLDGVRPRIIVTHSDPPPNLVTWENIAPHVAAAGPDELIVGIGKHGKVVKVSLTLDSPHFMANMGSGAGKSNQAGFWLLQELLRGGIALILDPKHFSHPWAFKDIDAEYGLLPNVRYARWIPDLHDAMCWLGRELSERTERAEQIINSRGELLGDVGPRLFILAEELNLATPLLKQHWADVRGPDDVKKSPALTALGAVAFAGRAVKMHLIVIGQQLTADTLGGGGGGGAVRENIGVKCMSRYSPNAWKMQVGDVAMPPSPWAPGRVQCVAGGTISEAQVPYVEKRLRDLALAGEVTTPCPVDMPGAGRSKPQVTVAGVPAIRMAADQPSVLGITLGQAVAEGILRRTKESARKEAQRQPGFPDPLNPDAGPGVAKLYRPSELDEWERSRVRALR